MAGFRTEREETVAKKTNVGEMTIDEIRASLRIEDPEIADAVANIIMSLTVLSRDSDGVGYMLAFVMDKTEEGDREKGSEVHSVTLAAKYGERQPAEMMLAAEILKKGIPPEPQDLLGMVAKIGIERSMGLRTGALGGEVIVNGADGPVN